MAATGAIRLFEADPDLLEAVPEAERALALRAAAVPTARASLGSWDTSAVGSPSWGVLIVDGMFVREVGFAGSTAAELLGSGDVVLVGGDAARTAFTVPMGEAWTVIEPGRVAILDDHLQATIRRWPHVAGCLLQRSERRAARLAMAQAISHLTRVDARVLMMLWLLADRWGRVASQALVIPLPLTHRTLARLVGARRPSVTTAISQLSQRGLLSRRDDGAWVVHGTPPAELERVGIEPLPAHQAAARRQAMAALPPARQDGDGDGEGDGHPLRPAIAEIRRRMAADVPRLAAAYEAQRDRTLEVTERSRRARENARRLREARSATREADD